MVGKTERTLQRNIIDPIQEMIGYERFRQNKASGVVIYAGRTIYIAGANDERSENKIRGLTLSGAYGDEVTLWPESFFKMLLSRLRVKGARFYGTTNPDSPFHWLKTEFLNRENELNIKTFQFLLRDNTTLDPEYIRSLELEYQGLWYRRFILGEWCQAEGAIYDMFDENIHVRGVEAYNNQRVRRKSVGVDYGTSNPTAAILIDEYEDGHLHAAAEYYYDGRANQKQKTDAEYIADMSLFYTQNRLAKDVPLIIDPSAASLKTEARKHGFHVRDAENSVLDGIRTVSSRLTLGTLLIDPRCKRLIKEMPSYVWDPHAQQRGEDCPLKVNDHACDALRYGVMSFVRGQSGGGCVRTY